MKWKDWAILPVIRINTSTPAHDVNDYMLGEKYGLETIDIFNDDGTISEAAGLYVGLDRMDVRKQISRDLNEAGLMEKIEDYTNKVGFSERTNVAIEPKLSTQWFLSMQHFADIALAPVMDDEIEFYPKKYKNTYRHWLENIKDWCISLRPRPLCQDLYQLDGERPRLVHLPPALVGPPHPGLVLPSAGRSSSRGTEGGRGLRR